MGQCPVSDTCHSHCGQRPREKARLRHAGQPDLIAYAGDEARDVQVTVVAWDSELLRLQQPARVCHYYVKMTEPTTRGRHIFLLLLLLDLPGHTETIGGYV